MPLDPEELEAKFLYCTRYILPADHIDEAIASFRGHRGNRERHRHGVRPGRLILSFPSY